jgi:hypothetical protein
MKNERKHYCITITSKTGKTYKRSLEDVICPKCKKEYTRAYKSSYIPFMCKTCSQLENNYKKKFHGCATIGDLCASYYRAIKQKASARNIKFNLSKEFLWDLFLKQEGKCALSGLPISIKTYNRWSKSGKSRHYDTKLVSGSLDRIDSSLDYTEDNVQWVHKVINIMKNTLSTDNFIYMCRQVQEFNEKKDNIEPTLMNGEFNDLIMRRVQRLTVEDNHSNNTDTRIPFPDED